MATQPDTLIITGPAFAQVPLDQIQVTPTGGTQGPLSNFINGGTVAAGGALTTYGSITPAGSALASATAVTAVTTELGAAASTTGIVMPLAAGVLGQQLLVINKGTAAVHVYGTGGDTIDTTAGTTGVALTNGFGAFFVPIAANTYITACRGTITS